MHQRRFHLPLLSLLLSHRWNNNIFYFYIPPCRVCVCGWEGTVFMHFIFRYASIRIVLIVLSRWFMSLCCVWKPFWGWKIGGIGSSSACGPFTGTYRIRGRHFCTLTRWIYLPVFLFKKNLWLWYIFSFALLFKPFYKKQTCRHTHTHVHSRRAGRHPIEP